MKTVGPVIVAPHPIANAAAGARACPRCHSAVFNVSRRFVDLILSVFLPIRRYRCIAMKCSWEGNLRERSKPLLAPLRSPAYPPAAENIVGLDRSRIRRAAMLEKPQG